MAKPFPDEEGGQQSSFNDEQFETPMGSPTKRSADNDNVGDSDQPEDSEDLLAMPPRMPKTPKGTPKPSAPQQPVSGMRVTTTGQSIREIPKESQPKRKPSGGGEKEQPGKVTSSNFFCLLFCKKVIDLPEGQINEPLSGKHYCLPFLPATPSSPSRILEGLFELTWCPSRDLDSPRAPLRAEIPGHRQKQLTLTLIVRLLKAHFFNANP